MTNGSKFSPGTCVVCGCAPVAPYRWIVNGRVVEGCVARAHDGQLYGESLAWHERKVAKKIRAETARHERSLFRGKLGAAVVGEML